MTEITITAVYENSVLRPTAPLDLPEHAEVHVTVSTSWLRHAPMQPRQKLQALFVAAGLVLPDNAAAPVGALLSERERSALDARLRAAGGMPLSEMINEDREDRA